MAATPRQVLAGLKKENLLKMAKQEGHIIAPNASKDSILSTICPLVEGTGIRKITSEFSKLQLEEFVDTAKIDIGEASSTKSVLQKRLFEAISREGVDTFFSKRLSVAQVKEVLKVLGLNPSSDSKEKLVQQAVDAFHLVGIQAFLSKFEVSFLQQCMENLKLKYNTDSKAKIVYALATQTSAKRDKVDRPEATFSDEKKSIKKGITYEDIFQHYFLDELVEWSKENGLKCSGKKKEVIIRILAFLGGDRENTMASNPTAKEEKPAKPKEKKPKESSQKTTKTKKVEEEVVEEEEEQEKEAPKQKPKKGTKDSSKSKKRAATSEDEQDVSGTD